MFPQLPEIKEWIIHLPASNLQLKAQTAIISNLSYVRMQGEYRHNVIGFKGRRNHKFIWSDLLSQPLCFIHCVQHLSFCRPKALETPGDWAMVCVPQAEPNMAKAKTTDVADDWWGGSCPNYFSRNPFLILLWKVKNPIVLAISSQLWQSGWIPKRHINQLSRNWVLCSAKTTSPLQSGQMLVMARLWPSKEQKTSTRKHW